MILTFWGTRGSCPAPGPQTLRYGGNTACIELRTAEGSTVVLDAGTGIRGLGDALLTTAGRFDILLSHLHLDHIQGLGFFAPLLEADAEVHIWGPPRASDEEPRLGMRLMRYLSPPLFPVGLHELPCRIQVHEVTSEPWELPGLVIQAAPVSHPGATLGYRLTDGSVTVAYVPDHELGLAHPATAAPGAWQPVDELCAGVDLLVHDAQYTEADLGFKTGWGHSTLGAALDFADRTGARHLVAFHHDPAHDDDRLDEVFAAPTGVALTPAREGRTMHLPGGRPEPESAPYAHAGEPSAP